MRLLAAVALVACGDVEAPSHPRSGTGPTSGPPAYPPSAGGWGSAADLAKLPGEIYYVARDRDGRGRLMRIARGVREQVAERAEVITEHERARPVVPGAVPAPSRSLATRREPDGSTRIYLDGARLTGRSELTRDEHSPTRSADGRLVAYVVQRGTRRHVWIRDVEAHSEVDITPEGIHDVEPAFSPDGRWVVVSRTRGHDVDLWAIPTGVGEPVRLTTERFDDVHPLWR